MIGKTALITGGASGIGYAIAESLLQAGANVVISDLDPAAGDAALSKLQKIGPACAFVAGDVSSPQDARRMVDTSVTKLGRLDILVNNAGLQFVAPVVEYPEERWNQIITVLLTGTFLCTKYALPHMISQKWGRIINVASLHGKVASPFKAAYISAKHGVLGFTKVVALEVGQHNITCNAICPAYVRTPLVEKQIQDQAKRHGISPDEVVGKIMLEPAAIRRLLEPEEVAAMALYLCSDAASGVTGSALDIDLGWTAH